MNCVKLFIRSFLIVFILFLASQTISSQINPDNSGSRSSSDFKAGAGISNITPFLGDGIIGGWNAPPATHIHDELHARCLVLDDGDTRLAFVVVDNLHINRELFDEAKRLIYEETNLPAENILMSSIHTHSATSALGHDLDLAQRGVNYDNVPFDEYQKFLIRRIADVVRIAINNLEPARIGWGVGSVPQYVFTRRWKMKPGTSLPNPFGGQDKGMTWPGHNNPSAVEPDGNPDPDVSFISVKSTSGRPIALLANYSTHYVGGVPSGHISADYFAVFANRMQELLKADRQVPPFVAMMSNGTSGNLITVNYDGPPEKRYQPYEKMNVVADDIAREVMRVYNTLQYHDWVPLKAAQEELTLKVRKPDRKMIARANMVLSRPDTVIPVHPHEKVYAIRILKLMKWPDNIDIVLQTFRVGDLGIAAIPFEVVSPIGLELKAKSPFKSSFNISLANGWYGYLPTPEQHKLGGYETWMGTNCVETKASRKITDKLLRLYAKLK